jgi:hypothetical protein
MASREKRIIICRHGARRRDGLLSRKGEQQSRVLGQSLEAFKGSISCIFTSQLTRAVETGRIVQDTSLPGASFFSDADLDEQRFGEGESDWALCIRIQEGLRRILQAPGDVVVVITHSGWIFSCFRLMGVINAGASFSPVRLASSHHVVLPCMPDDVAVDHALKGWFYEQRKTYDAALEGCIPVEVSKVQKRWREKPSHTFGDSIVVMETDSWVVKTDVWNMEKHKNICTYVRGTEPLLAISTHNMGVGGQPLACLRDLKQEHLASLIDIDSRFPDQFWIKFILYPPWVYRLHIHIHRRGPCMGSLPCRNVHLLGDVISMVRDGSIQGGSLLVYHF